MLWKVDGASDSVHDPAQDYLLSGPEVIPLLQLLLGDGLFPVIVLFVVASEDLVDCMVGVPSDTQSVDEALYQLDKVVDVHINVGQRWTQWPRFLVWEGICSLRNKRN